jgi:predicted nucleic acid-binding protein
VLTLDTSAIYAILNRRDGYHRAMVEARDNDSGPYFIAAGSLGELAYMVEANLGARALAPFLGDLERGAYTLDCGEQDLARIQVLVIRYESLGLGFSDATVVACAERHAGRVLTSDRRHFDVVAGEGTITVLPQ